MKTFDFDSSVLSSDNRGIPENQPLSEEEIKHLMEAVLHNTLSDDDLQLLGKIRMSDMISDSFPEILKNAAISAMPKDQMKRIESALLQMSSVQDTVNNAWHHLEDDMKLLDDFIEEVHKRTGCTRNEIIALLKPVNINYDGVQIPFWEMSAKSLNNYLEDVCTYIKNKTGDNPFSNSNLKIYNSNAIDALVYSNTTASARKYQQDPDKLCVMYHGKKYTFDKLYKELGTLSKKLLDTSIAILTRDIFSLAGDKSLDEICIPIKDYLRAQNKDIDPDYSLTGEALEKDKSIKKGRLKDLTKEIKNSCAALSLIQISWDENDDFCVLNIISKAQIKGGNIIITFSKDVASLLRNKPLITYYPTCLLQLDSRKTNAYCIGRKIAQHAGQRNNQRRGTDSTLSVKSLLDVAPEIPEYNETKERGDWKTRIFDKFENAMNALIDDIQYLTRWEYRNPINGNVVSRSAARAMTYSAYVKLMVDYIVKDNPQDITET